MSGSGSTGRTSGIATCCCSGACSALTSSMLIIYMRNSKSCTPRTPPRISSRNRNVAHFWLRRQFREMDSQESILKFRPCALVIDGNPDGDLAVEPSMEPLDAQIRRHLAVRRFLPLMSGNHQDAVIPRQLKIGSIDSWRFYENDDLRLAFANIDHCRPRRTLAWLGLEFEIHNYSRIFRRSLSSLMNSWTSLKSR